MKTVKGDKSRIRDHRAARATLDRIFPEKAKAETPPPVTPPKSNPFPHIKIP